MLIDTPVYKKNTPKLPTWFMEIASTNFSGLLIFSWV